MNEFNANIPIYLQVVDRIKLQIMNETLKPGDKIASVRELSIEYGVNPNTVQKAFAELEREGFIRTERAVGRYVADNQKLILDCKERQIKEMVDEFVMKMQSLGVKFEDIHKYLEKVEEEL